MAKDYEATSDELDPGDITLYINLLNQRRDSVKKLLQAHNYKPGTDKLNHHKKEKTIEALQRNIAIMDRSISLCKPLFKTKGGKDEEKKAQ